MKKIYILKFYMTTAVINTNPYKSLNYFILLESLRTPPT